MASSLADRAAELSAPSPRLKPVSEGWERGFHRPISSGIVPRACILWVLEKLGVGVVPRFECRYTFLSSLFIYYAFRERSCSWKLGRKSKAAAAGIAKLASLRAWGLILDVFLRCFWIKKYLSNTFSILLPILYRLQDLHQSHL